MKRIRDLGISTVQVGIRSICQEEAEYIKKEKLDNVFFAPSLPLDKIISALGKNIYITFDLDGLDPSIMPSTGTPEPGGLGWYESLELIKKVAEKKNIVGADVVELDPIPGMAAPDFLAAKLAYKIINYSLTQ
jgi:agmatinase